MMTYYKFMQTGCIETFTDWQWYVGEWMLPYEGYPIEGEGDEMQITGDCYCFIRPRAEDVVAWLDAELYEFEVEPGGAIIECPCGCVTTASCRLVKRLTTWNEQAMRNLICDYAERAALEHDNLRPVMAMARRLANGEATRKEVDAVWAAGEISNRTPAELVVWDAFWWLVLGDTSSWKTIGPMVRRVAQDARGVAPDWDEEYQWQTQHLLGALGLDA